MDAKFTHLTPDLELATPQAASGRFGALGIPDLVVKTKVDIFGRKTHSTLHRLTMGKEYQRPRGPLLPRRWRITIVAILFLSWSLTFTLLSSERVPFVRPASSADWLPVRKLTCTDTFWDPDKCGMDGVHCEPFYDRLVAFQCPPDCIRDGAVRGRPHLAGSHEITGRPLVIGGPIYRGDSYICPAAIHAGVAGDAAGGCGVARYMGMTNSFSSSYIYDVESVDVQTYFPMSFRFTVESEDMACPARAGGSPGWALPCASAAHTALAWRTTGSRAARAVWALAVAYGHLSLREAPWARARLWLSPSPAPAPVAAAAAADRKVPTPQVLEPEIFMDSISNITFRWATPTPTDVEGISMLVDDVERARRFFGKGAKNEVREGERADSFFWQRTPQAFVDYIRFGYIKNGKVLKYSQPGIWFTNGTWTGIPAEK